MNLHCAGASKLRNILLTTVLSLLIPAVSLAIDAPPNTRGSQVAQSEIKWEWDWVPGVTRYEVTVDGAVVGTTPDPRYTSYNMWPGEHSLSVKAIDGNLQFSERSETAQVIADANFNGSSPSNNGGSPTSSPAPTVQNDQDGVVTQPQNPRGQEVGQSTVKWQWDWVPGATQYEVTIDGGAASLISEQQFFSRNLWAGDHSMTVKAVSADWQYSPASKTAKIVVSSSYNAGSPANSYIPGEGSPNNNSQPTVAIAPPPPAAPQPSNDQGSIDPASWSMPEVSQKPGYELTFSDEFNGSTLNRSRWNTQLRWDGEFNGERYEYRRVNGESQFYVNTFSSDQEHLDTVAPRYTPFEFNGSRVAIRAIRNPLKQSSGNRTHGSLSEMVSQQDFLSGALTTYDKFTQKFGYFEARIKLPSHVGTFPAFWLHHQRRRWEGTRRSEIDIMENLGHAPWYVYNTFHYHNNVTAGYAGDAVFVKPQPEGQIYTGTDYSQDYHTYAVEWEPGHIAWMIDGQVVSQVWNENVNHEELYIILNLAMGGNWTNFPTSSGGLGRPENERFPASYDLENFANPALEIDWVRVYRRR